MQFGILGPVEVTDAGRRVDVAGGKQAALLVALLLHANEVVPASRLIDALWDESPPETAGKALQVYVSQLRKALGRDTVVTRAPGYLLRVAPGALDLERFEADRRSDAVARRVREDFRGGIRAGVATTPTLFADSVRHAGRPGPELWAVLRPA